MNFSPDELQVINAVKYSPAVSIILPFDTSISLTAELGHKIKIAADEVKRQLQASYPEEKWQPVYNKLDEMTASLVYDKSKKGIAIYVSPTIARAFYLSAAPVEKIVVDESFEIRDLAFSHQSVFSYFVLMLSGTRASAFVVEGDIVNKVPLGIPDRIEAYKTASSERVANFSDPSEHKEIVQDKFLRSIDNALSALLNANHLPVFLIASDRLLGHFKHLTANNQSIVDMIHGNYDNCSVNELLEVVKPHLKALTEKMDSELFAQIEKAMGAGTLDFGVSEVWKSANDKLGRILVIEKSFKYPADYAENATHIHKHDDEGNKKIYLKDAVDDIIEKVIRYGGEVRFVEDGALSDYMNIVLIRRY